MFMVDNYIRPASERLGTTQQEIMKQLLQDLYNTGIAQPPKKDIALDDFQLEFEHMFTPSISAIIVAQMDPKFFEGKEHANIFLATRKEIELAEEAYD